MIFFNQRIIFIHIPRCGGTSIEQNLWYKEFGKYFSFKETNEKNLLQGFVDKYSNKHQSDGLQHLTAFNIKKIYPKEFEQFYKFTFIRNPFSRAVSLYLEIMKYRKDLRDFLAIYKDSSFKNFLKLISVQSHTHWMPMWKFFETKQVDYIGRFENYNADLEILGKKKKINFIDENFSGDTNFSEKNSYQAFYDDGENIDLVKKIYAKDLESFGYNLEEFYEYENNKLNSKKMKPHIKLDKKENNFRRFVKRILKKNFYIYLNRDKFD
jgi:hypothetical protein